MMRGSGSKKILQYRLTAQFILIQKIHWDAYGRIDHREEQAVTNSDLKSEYIVFLLCVILFYRGVYACVHMLCHLQEIDRKVPWQC